VRQDEGVSTAYTFDQANATALSKRATQYFEILGNRAIYHDAALPALDHGNGQDARSRYRLPVGAL
jgi:arylsulfatase